MLSFKNFIAEETQAELDLITEMAVAVVGGEENYGTLDELSKKTLRSYINKSAYSAAGYSAGVALNSMKVNSSKKDNSASKLGRRLMGINDASRRLAKEDFDAILKMVEESTELNELSKKKLANYIDAATNDVKMRLHKAMNSSYVKGHLPKPFKRTHNIQKAARKLTKESTEMKAPVLASVEPYTDAHSLHDKAEQHRQIAKQAEHRYFNGGDDVDRVIYHAHMAKHHQFLENHANHTESPETAATHRKMKLRNMKHIGSVAEGNGSGNSWSAINPHKG